VGIKIIVIEDDANYAEMIQGALTGIADEIIICETWEQAQLAFEKKPNVLWVDLAVPGTDPDSVAKRIAGVRQSDGELIIVVASGYLTPERRAQLGAAGVDFMDNKMNRVNPLQIASLIILGMLAAKRRGARTIGPYLDRALDFMHARFPESAISLT